MKKYTATFSGGQTITRNSDNRYAFAWALIGIEYGQIEVSGMSATRANAAKNAQAQLWAPVSARDRRNARLFLMHAKMAEEQGFASVSALHAHWDAEAVKFNADFRIEIVEVTGA